MSRRERREFDRAAFRMWRDLGFAPWWRPLWPGERERARQTLRDEVRNRAVAREIIRLARQAGCEP